MDKIIIANWKNNPATLNEAKELFSFESAEAKKYPNIKVAICPPEKFFKEVADSNPAYLGAQDFFWQLGEVVPAKYVLIGHSDRRYGLGETDEVINQKLKAALAAGVTPVLLVGERNKNDDRKTVLEEQLTKSFANLLTSGVRKVLIAYEPVWAISTNPDAEPDIPENTLEAIRIIGQVLNSKFEILNSKLVYLYGGSVNKSNVADFLKHSEISGAVIGGASLRKEEFAEILKIVETLK